MNREPLLREAVVAVDGETLAGALRRYVAGHPRLAVRATCVLPALQTEVALLRDVIVTLEPLDASTALVAWVPADGGRFPRFEGTLRVVERGTAAALRLEGGYDDPSIVRGDPTDGELAFRLAHATARTMLEEVSKAVGDGAVE